jgi:hypothetical protein
MSGLCNRRQPIPPKGSICDFALVPRLATAAARSLVCGAGGGQSTNIMSPMMEDIIMF